MGTRRPSGCPEMVSTGESLPDAEGEDRFFASGVENALLLGGRQRGPPAGRNHQLGSPCQGTGIPLPRRYGVPDGLSRGVVLRKATFLGILLPVDAWRSPGVSATGPGGVMWMRWSALHLRTSDGAAGPGHGSSAGPGPLARSPACHRTTAPCGGCDLL
jgi:hypothetical protein